MAQEFHAQPSPQPNSRRYTRTQVQVDATVLIVFPEETFSTFPIHGKTLDLSLSGIRIATTAIDDRLYCRLLQAVRYAKVSFKLPGTGESILVHGCVVWVNYDNRQAPPLCQIGITFDRINDLQLHALERSLAACEDLRSQSPPPPQTR